MAAIFLGCNNDDGIRVYTVPKESIASSAPGRELALQPSAPSTPTRLLGSFIPVDDSMVFLKATGQPEQLEGLADELAELTATVAKTPEGKIIWDLPDQWQTKPTPSGSMAMAIIEAPTDFGPAEFTVTVLGKPSGDSTGYLIANYDRWRTQLTLPSAGAFEVDENEISTVLRDDREPAYLIDLTGLGSGQMGGRPPFAGGGSLPPATPRASPESSSESSRGTPKVAVPPGSGPSTAETPQITYEAPDNWALGESRPFRLATFNVGQGDTSGEVIVSTAVSNPATITEMWQGQLTPDKSADDIKELANTALDSAETFEAGDRSGKVYLLSEDESDQAKTLMTAVVDLPDEPGRSLFVKFVGSRKNAQAIKSELIEFTGTVQLSPRD
jgi:hypothetical protein